MNRNLAVIAYPPHYPRWQFWKPHKPFMLSLSECIIDNLNGTARVIRPKKGYAYKLADILETE